MAESNAAAKWIYTRLIADAQLTAVVGTKIYIDIPPQTTPPVAPPFVLYSMLSGVPLRTVGRYVVWSDMIWLIYTVDETQSYAGAIKTGADRIDTVLHAQSGTNVDGIVHACVRIMAYQQQDPIVNGRIVKKLGGQYRIYASTA